MQGRQGALGLQQTSQFKQQRPSFPEQPALKSDQGIVISLTKRYSDEQTNESLPVGIIVVSTVGTAQSTTEDDVFLVHGVVVREHFQELVDGKNRDEGSLCWFDVAFRASFNCFMWQGEVAGTLSHSEPSPTLALS